jgi:hypothetical protein
MRELLQVFVRDVSSTTLSAGLEALCTGANRVFGADRTSVWLHDRRARMVRAVGLVRRRVHAQERRIPISDPLSPRREPCAGSGPSCFRAAAMARAVTRRW